MDNDDISQKLAELKQRILNYSDKSQENMNYQLDPNKAIADKRSEMKNLPQDDVNNVISELRNDSNTDRDMLMSAGVMSGGLKNLAAPAATKYGSMLVGKYGGPIKDLAEEYLPKAISGKITDFYHGALANNNVAQAGNMAKDAERIKQLSQMAEQKPVFEAPVDPTHKPFDLDIFQATQDRLKAEAAAKQALRDSPPASSMGETAVINPEASNTTPTNSIIDDLKKKYGNN